LEPKALSKQFIIFEDVRKVDSQNERPPPSHDDVERKSFEDRHQALERAASDADNDTTLQGVARRISVWVIWYLA
jgi:serine/threonine-protein phosphatase 2B catalytic subunit